MDEVMRSYLCFIIVRSMILFGAADSTLRPSDYHTKLFSIPELSNSRERGAL
jgi:hypothetical protein